MLKGTLGEQWQPADARGRGRGVRERACSLPSAGDRSNIIFGVPKSNYKEQGKFKDNIIK